MKLPTEHKWSQTNEGDIFGVLHSTREVTFDDYGKLTLSKKPFSVFDSTFDSDFGYVLSINYFDSSYIVLTDDEIFQGNLDGTNFTELTWPPAHGLNSDAVVCYGLYQLTVDTTLYTWDGGTLSGDWVNRSASLTTGVPHPMEVFESQATYKLAIGNGNLVQTYDSSYNANATVLTLPSYQQVTTIRYRNGYLYVGTKNLNGGEGRIYIWNGNGSAAQYEIPVGCSWVFSLTPYGTTVAAIVSSGILGRVAGTTFEPIAALPVYYRQDTKWQGSGGLLLNGKVFNRGMITVGDRIYLNIEGELAEGYIPEMHSGLWCYDPRIGLYHRNGTSSTRYIKDAGLSLSDNTLTTTVAHGLKDGDGVVFSSISALSGVDNDIVYYVKVISTTEIKLARSRKSILKERYITLSGTPGGSDILMYIPNTDTSDTSSSATSGAVFATVYNENNFELWKSSVIWGARINNQDGTAVYSINSLCPSYNIGAFEIQRIYSPSTLQSWGDFKSFIDNFQLSNEQFITKYRHSTKEETISFRGVWLDSRTINSVSLLYEPWEDIEIGNEIVVTGDYGRGYSAHVIDMNPSSNTYSIVLDEDIGTAGEMCTFYVTNYRKDQVHTPETSDDSLVSSSSDVSGTWVQIKCELRGFEMAVAINDLENTKDE